MSERSEPRYKVGDEVTIDDEFYQPSGEIIEASYNEAFGEWWYTVRVDLRARESSIAREEAGGDE